MYHNQRYPYNVNPTTYHSNRYPYPNGYRYPTYSHAAELKSKDKEIRLRDYGPDPFVMNINDAAKENNNFRTALWTGEHLQLTLMSIPVGGEIGLELHPDHDQFLRIEEGQGMVKMGNQKDNMNFQEEVYDDYAIIIPAGTWHNLINTGNIPIKLYSIYAPPKHPHGTVHRTKEDAEAAEKSESRQRR